MKQTLIKKGHLTVAKDGKILFQAKVARIKQSYGTAIFRAGRVGDTSKPMVAIDKFVWTPSYLAGLSGTDLHLIKAALNPNDLAALVKACSGHVDGKNATVINFIFGSLI